MGVLTFLAVATDMDATGNFKYIACSLVDGVNDSTASGTKLKVYVLPKDLLIKYITNGACVTKNVVIVNDMLVGKQGDLSGYAKMQTLPSNNYSIVGTKTLVFLSQPSDSCIMAVDPTSVLKVITADSLNSLAPEVRPKFANIDYTLAPGKIIVSPKKGKYEQVKPMAVIPARSNAVPEKPPIGKLADENGGITKVYDKTRVQSDDPYVAAKASEASAQTRSEEKRRSRLISGGSMFDANETDALGTSARINPYSMSFRYSYAPDADMSKVPDWGNYLNRGLDPNNPDDFDRALRNCTCHMKWTAAMNTLTSWSTHLASYFSQMKLIATRSIPTLGVNTREFVVNPDYISHVTNGQLMFLLYHELFHVLLGHTIRCGDRDPYLWNIACDAIVNASLCKEFGIDWKDPAKTVSVSGVNTVIKTIAGIEGGVFDDVDLENETVESYYAKLIQRNGDLKDMIEKALEQARKSDSAGSPSSQANKDQDLMDKAKELQKEAQELADELGKKANDANSSPDDKRKSAIDKDLAERVSNAMTALSDILEADKKSCEMVEQGSQPGTPPMTRSSYRSIAGDIGRAANMCDQITNDIDKMDNPKGSSGEDLGNKSDDLAQKIQELAEELRNVANQGTDGNQQGNQSGQSGNQSGQNGQSGGQSGQSGQGSRGNRANSGQSGNQSGQNGQSGSGSGSGSGQNGSDSGSSSGNDGSGTMKQDTTGMQAKVSVKLNAGTFDINIPLDIDTTNGDSPLDNSSASGPRLPGMKDSYGGLTEQDLRKIREQELKDLLGKAKSVAEIYKAKDGGSRELGLGGGSLLGRMFQMMEVDPVNWKTLLKKFVNATEKVESSLSTPYAPLVTQNLYIPGDRKCDPDALYDLIVAVDTSGSISQEQLNEAMGQIYRMYSHFKIRGWILWWSDSVTSADAITKRSDLLVTKPTSTGGTQIDQLISWLDNHAGRGNHSRARKGKIVCNNLHPCAILVITDGYVGSIPKPTKIDSKKFIWLITDKSNYLNFNPPYGTKALYDNNYSV